LSEAALAAAEEEELASPQRRVAMAETVATVAAPAAAADKAARVARVILAEREATDARL
jgi:hypothetical protein